METFVNVMLLISVVLNIVQFGLAQRKPLEPPKRRRGRPRKETSATVPTVANG